MRLISTTNFSNRAIGRMTHLSHNTVAKYRQRLRDKGVLPESLSSFNDKQLINIVSEPRGVDAQKRMSFRGIDRS